MPNFVITSKFKPAGDQPKAIDLLVRGIENNNQHQILLGATGTGKTFTVANVISRVQKKTLVLAHNKTLAAQLYGEFKSLFPNNKVEYFVSNFDFYQPEAYLPKSDTFIEKSSQSNMEIEMMRLSALNSLVTRNDTIVVASVAAIYGEFDPREYKKLFFEVRVGDKLPAKKLAEKLVFRGYERNNLGISNRQFRLKGDVLELAPAWTQDNFFKLSFFGDEIEDINMVDSLNKRVITKIPSLTIFPADDYITSNERTQEAVSRIEKELTERLAYFNKNGMLLEAERLRTRTEHDLESLRETGRCSGVENYSAHLELRSRGEAPFTLIDYFGDDYLLVIDESHISIPQISGMHNTDKSRKSTLVQHGFRLPSALDNRPLNYAELQKRMSYTLYTSATPGKYEIELTKGKVIEQIIRPTGLVDPVVEVEPLTGQVDHLIKVSRERIKAKERILVTTMTIRMAEDLTNYLQSLGFKATYLHNELKTLQRSRIINDLRRGRYDILVGINLLREGIDIPEVSFIAILDADKESFLRDGRSLIQIIGRAARNVNGMVIMYGDRITKSMQIALDETNRRRQIQIDHNEKHGIKPQTIKKPISDIGSEEVQHQIDNYVRSGKRIKKTAREKLITDLRQEMLAAAKGQNYEKAAELRDAILELENE